MVCCSHREPLQSFSEGNILKDMYWNAIGVLCFGVVVREISLEPSRRLTWR